MTELRNIDVSPLEGGHVAAVVGDVVAELAQAVERHPVPYHSPHEGWAIIREELDELWEHVRANTGRSPAARAEAIQVAMVAVRYVLEVCNG